jgi:hypothetical protein
MSNSLGASSSNSDIGHGGGSGFGVSGDEYAELHRAWGELRAMVDSLGNRLLRIQAKALDDRARLQEENAALRAHLAALAKQLPASGSPCFMCGQRNFTYVFARVTARCNCSGYACQSALECKTGMRAAETYCALCRFEPSSITRLLSGLEGVPSRNGVCYKAKERQANRAAYWDRVHSCRDPELKAGNLVIVDRGMIWSSEAASDLKTVIEEMTANAFVTVAGNEAWWDDHMYKGVVSTAAAANPQQHLVPSLLEIIDDIYSRAPTH